MKYSQNLINEINKYNISPFARITRQGTQSTRKGNRTYLFTFKSTEKIRNEINQKKKQLKRKSVNKVNGRMSR